MIVIAWLSMKKSSELICFGRLKPSHPRLVITFLVSQPLLQFNQFRMIAILSLDYYPTQCVIICFPFFLSAFLLDGVKHTHTSGDFDSTTLTVCVCERESVCASCERLIYALFG